MKPIDYPYEECEWCETLEDCPHPDLDTDDLMALPMCPDVCPKPITIMAATLKKHKLTRKRDD